MQIFLNGEEKFFTGPLTVAQMLEQCGMATRRVAVEVNREIVPRSEHARHQLQEQDRIEVVFAIGGG